MPIVLSATFVVYCLFWSEDRHRYVLIGKVQTTTRRLHNCTLRRVTLTMTKISDTSQYLSYVNMYYYHTKTNHTETVESIILCVFLKRYLLELHEYVTRYNNILRNRYNTVRVYYVTQCAFYFIIPIVVARILITYAQDMLCPLFTQYWYVYM